MHHALHVGLLDTPGLTDECLH